MPRHSDTKAIDLTERPAAPARPRATPEIVPMFAMSRKGLRRAFEAAWYAANGDEKLIQWAKEDFRDFVVNFGLKIVKPDKVKLEPKASLDDFYEGLKTVGAGDAGE